MTKLNYEFDNEPLPPEPGAWDKRIRLIVIFIIIAAITAGIIYYLIPKAEKPAANPPPAIESNNAPTPPVSVESSTPPTPSVETPPTIHLPDAPDTTAPTNNTAPEPGEEQTKENLDPSVVVDLTPDNSTNSETPAENWENPTPEPEKGKPWIGDPTEDGPVKVENTRPVNLADQISQGQELLKKSDPTAALQIAEKALNLPGLSENSPEWREAAALLTQANLALLRSGRRPQGFAVEYTVKSGDNFSRLAAKFSTTIEAIKISSNLPLESNLLLLGKKLTIYPGPWKIKVEKSARLLKLYNQYQNRERLFMVFDIGIGRLGKTPTADFVISAKLKNPDWYTSEGRIIKYGDPENMLGNYFLKLATAGTPDKPLLGYGIHGTNDDASVTKSLSNGCIRMRNSEVETLYNIVPARTPVEIVD